MSNNNYQNFIYLFNDENFINIKQNKIKTTSGFSTNPYELELDYNSIIVDPGVIPGNALVFSPESNVEFRDYPRQNTSTTRDKQKLLARTLLKNEVLPGPPLPYISNDPFHSPYKLTLFNIENDSLSLNKLTPNLKDDKTKYTFKFVDEDGNTGPGFANPLLNKVSLKEITEEEYGAELYYLTSGDFPAFLNPKLQQLESNNFRYIQEVPIGFSLEDNFDKESIEKFAFGYLDLFISQGPIINQGNIFQQRAPITKDITTMIGVPYDFQTVLENDNSKKSGIATLQPRYEKIYNYYDPQYEPLTLALIEQNVIDERSLPSIYDFLYLEEDFNSIIAFLGLPKLDPEDINLSNLNQYLDFFVNVYAQYLELEVDGLTIEGFIGEDYFDVEKNLTQISKDLATGTADDFASINNQVIENSKLDWTDLTSVLKQLPLLVDFISDIKTKGTPLWMQQLKTGVYFSEKSMNVFNQTLDKDNFFPFLVKVNLPTETKGPLGNLFSKSGVLDSLNAYAASLVVPNDATPSTVDDFYGGVVNGDANQNFNLFSEAKMTTFKMYLENEPEVISEDYGVDLYLDTLFSIGDESLKSVFEYVENKDVNISSELSSLLSKLKFINFQNSLKELFEKQELLRTPVDIQNGKFAHQETLMYEIAKYDFDNEGNETFVQSIFLPITQQSELSYYDTQVIPYKDYHYKIFAHKAIVGTEYGFVPHSQDELMSLKAAVAPDLLIYNAKYEVKPFIQFVRVPYYNSALVNTAVDKINYTRIEASPPLAPQVNFVPYRGINNKILVLLNNSIGELEQNPIVMFEEDKEILQSTAIAQDKQIYFVKLAMLTGIQSDAEIVLGGPLLYKSDDQEGTFQAYRIESKPTSYSDFEKDASLKVVELEVQRNFKNDSFLDQISPNKDYYYTFRFEDIHGKLSNPTSVYKVRMEQPAASAPYLKIDIVDINKEQEIIREQRFVTSKKVQKYLMLRPSEGQNNVVYKTGIIGNELTYDENGFPTDQGVGYETVNVEVGDTVKSVFGRKFKLRMTSKQTGKKIDVNFTVKQPEEVVNETGNIQFEKT